GESRSVATCSRLFVPEKHSCASLQDGEFVVRIVVLGRFMLVVAHVRAPPITLSKAKNLTACSAEVLR
ncbi:MAG: hypothetical protein RMM06_10385, partial [Armatimonadota bacterium]|nr:hypothetical protein [Armatimonadota bacterium]